MRRRRVALVAGLVVALAMPPADAAAKRSPLCATVKKRGNAPVLAVLTAFPAEVAPLVAATDVESTIELGGRPYYLGRIGRVRVVLGITGIGVANAEAAATAVLDGLNVAGVVMSGVAGSRHRIADVVVADEWVQRERPDEITTVNVAMRALAARGAAALPEPLEHCTRVPPASPGGAFVCMPFDPAVVLGGRGVTSDPYDGALLPCLAGDVLGCELPAPTTASLLSPRAVPPIVDDLVDQETAAVARVAAARNVPFVGVRAVSDGAGDPLGERDVEFEQFFDYYVLAARNAAIVTRAVVASLDDLGRTRRGRRACRLLAKRAWDRAAAAIAP